MDLFSVMVTGANRGIGLEFVRQLVRLNPPPKHIFATYRDCKSIQELRELRDAFQVTTKIYLIHMDVTNTGDITNAAKIVEDIVNENGLTLLINNAGLAQRGPFPEITRESLNLHFNTNTVGPVMLAQTLYPLLKRSAERRSDPGMSFSRAGVLNLSSLVASIERSGREFTQDMSVPSYKISKAALNMGMRIIAAEAKKDNILVIMMCPGWVKTDMGTQRGEIEVQDSIAAMLDTIPKLDESHSGVYMNRFGSPYPF